MSENGEKATYKAFFTDKIEKLYVRVRMVYTNGDIVYLKHNDNAIISFNGVETSPYCNMDPTEDYYILNLDDSYFDIDGRKFNIGISVVDFAFEHTFEFEYRTQTNDNVLDFYDLDTETGVYTFNYWDERAKFGNEIYNKDGKVVAFGV